MAELGGTHKMRPSPSSQLPIGLHFEQRGSELLALETQDLGEPCHMGWEEFQVGNPKLRVSLSLKTGQRNIPNLPSSQRALSPSALHLSGHVPADQREKVTSLPTWEWKMPSQEAGRGCQDLVM